MLEEMGYIRRNPHSRWSSPVLIVEKPQLPNQFSVTVDTRYPKSHLVTIAGCLAIFEVILQHLKLASVFLQLECVQGVLAIPT